MTTILQKRADWIGVLEMAHASATSDGEWARNVRAAFERVLGRHTVINVQVVQFDA